MYGKKENYKNFGVLEVEKDKQAKEKNYPTRNESECLKKRKLQVLESTDTVKQVERKEKIRKDYLRRTEKLLETKFCRRNFIEGINTWVIPLVRYSGPLQIWTKEELRQIDQGTKKLMTIHVALHVKDDIDYMYQKEKKEED